MHPPSKDDVADQEETTPGSEDENTDLVAMQAVIDQLQDLTNQLQARIESLEEKIEESSPAYQSEAEKRLNARKFWLLEIEDT